MLRKRAEEVALPFRFFRFRGGCSSNRGAIGRRAIPRAKLSWKQVSLIFEKNRIDLILPNLTISCLWKKIIFLRSTLFLPKRAWKFDDRTESIFKRCVLERLELRIEFFRRILARLFAATLEKVRYTRENLVVIFSTSRLSASRQPASSTSKSLPQKYGRDGKWRYFCVFGYHQ